MGPHRQDYDERGGDILVRLDPGVDGRGISLSLMPSYGPVRSGVAGLWDYGLAGDASAAASGGRLEARIGYGVATLGGWGLLTPYGGLTLSDQDDEAYRLGGRFEVGSGLDFNLEGARHASAAGSARHAIMLRGRLRW